MVKLKLHDFTLLTRRMTLPTPASDTRSFHDASLALLERFPLAGIRVRLTGVSAQDLVSSAPVQPTLFPDRQQEKRRDVENVLMRVKERFGGLRGPADHVREPARGHRPADLRGAGPTLPPRRR